MNSTDNTRILEEQDIISPGLLKEQLAPDIKTTAHINEKRSTISDILHGKDHRINVIVWPCSIHNTTEALEYAEWLEGLKWDFPHLHIIMRTYFEKPRTSIWWKWLINDPHLNSTFEMEEWLKIARNLLLEVNKIWLPVATEFLDPIIAQYLWDLVSWWAIWARTTESQIHREMASGLSPAIGFKNWTGWNLDLAINAIKSATGNHRFLWIDNEWSTKIMHSSWNPDWHLILRWWTNWTNYDSKSIVSATNALKQAWLNQRLVIDASHANTEWNPLNQIKVASEISDQITNWQKFISGVMLESNKNSGNQKFTPWITEVASLEEWVSITDPWINWENTTKVFQILNEATASRRG